MLASFEQLLQNVRAQGLKDIEPRLDNEHMPIVGSMYEGLTRELVTRSLFEPFDLRVKSGQIQFSDGRYSPQIDCMLVIGDGEKLPYTDNYVYKLRNVIAIFEVKKTLNQAEIQDALGKFAKVSDLAMSNFQQDRDKPDFITLVKIHKDAFRSVCRMAYPANAMPDNLPAIESDIFKLLFVDACTPLRIIFSFGGYTTEDGLRRGYSAAFGKIEAKDILGSPSLVICNDLSIVKANGMPFAPERPQKAGWDIYYSQSQLAIRNLINIIWHRITKIYAKDFLWLTDGKIYSHNVLMTYQGNNKQEITVLDHSTLRRNQLSKSEEFSPEPHLVSVEEYVILQMLHGEKLSISDDVEFLKALNNNIHATSIVAAGIGCPVRSPAWDTMADLLQHLARTGLIAKQEDSLVPTTSRCVLLMTKEGMFAGENRDGRFTRRLGGPGLFLPDGQQSTSAVVLGIEPSITRHSADQKNWLALGPQKDSRLIGELRGWVTKVATSGMRQPSRAPSINLVSVRYDEWRISTIRLAEGKYEIRVSDSVELLLRDIIFRWLSLPEACTEVGKPGIETSGSTLGQFNKSLFQLQNDVSPYRVQIPKCKTRAQYASDLLGVAMLFLVTHSALHVLLGHIDYEYTETSSSCFEEEETPVPPQKAKDRQAMEWSADIVAVKYVCEGRLGCYGKHGLVKAASKPMSKGNSNRRRKSKRPTMDANPQTPQLETSVLLIERAIAIATMYSERAWLHASDEMYISHPYPQWRLLACLEVMDICLQKLLSRERSSLNVPQERAVLDIVEARRGIVWAKTDPNVAARFLDVAQAGIGERWQTSTRPLLEPHAYVALPTYG